MPRIDITSPHAMRWSICTRDTERTLRAWFDEVLPWTWIEGRPIDEFEVLWPRIQVWPMWAWKLGPLSDPDWLTDSRVLGRLHDFPAKDGESGLYELAKLRSDLEAELRGLT